MIIAMERNGVSLGIAIFLIALLLFTIGTPYKTYSSPDEKRYIQSAQEMVSTGDWITPRYHGRARFQKPILFYWLAASGISVFRGGWFGARLPSAVCGALTVLLVYLLGNALYNRRTGLFSASLLAISGIFFVFSRLSTPDMLTLCLITLSIYIFVKIYFYDASDMLWKVFFVVMALAMLTKGVVGIIIPLAVIILFSRIYKKPWLIRMINIPLGLLIFFVLTLPWFIAMYKIHGDTYLQHIWQVETLGRIKSARGLENILRYLGAVLVIFLPVTLFLPGAIINIVRRRLINREDMLQYLWLFTAVIFFTFFGTKKYHYLLVLAPPLCIILGNYFSNIVERRRKMQPLLISFIVACIFIFTVLFGYLLPVFSKDDGLLTLSEKILALRKEGQEIGVGSHFISHNRVDSYLGINVKKVNVDLSEPAQQLKTSRHLLYVFLTKKERVFCLVTREDYTDYIADDLKKKIFILDKGWYWKKPNQIRLDKESVRLILRGDREAFIRAFKNEIHLISNRK